MSETMRLPDEVVKDPKDELKRMLGQGWEVEYQSGRFICSKDDKIWHVSEVYVGDIYRTSLLAITHAAKKAYGSRW